MSLYEKLVIDAAATDVPENCANNVFVKASVESARERYIEQHAAYVIARNPMRKAGILMVAAFDQWESRRFSVRGSIEICMQGGDHLDPASRQAIEIIDQQKENEGLI